MDNLGSEITVKVKEAIRAKLKEMKVNSSDEIIDYIMLLVTTKKSSIELAKSIDFVMESNTTVFVKWLSTIIKKLQQVTVSTTSPPLITTNISENNQILKSSTQTNENEQHDDILVCETNDVYLEDSDEEKEKFKLNLNINVEDIKASDKEKEKSCLLKLNVPKSAKRSENKISSLPDKRKQKICFSPTEDIKTNSSVQINKQNIKKSVSEMRNISIKNDSNMTINNDIVSKKSISDSKEKTVCKSKRPRISINSDDEDEKNIKLELSVAQTTKGSTKQITKELQKKNNKKSTHRDIVVKPLETNKDIREMKKKSSIRDLIVQRVDHQRGALALDTAFKYIQQQIGASDEEIAVIKKWRDYAVEMLRSKKV